jgi:hypothetical protein
MITRALDFICNLSVEGGILKKSPLPPLCQRGEKIVSLWKRGIEGDFMIKIFHTSLKDYFYIFIFLVNYFN